MKKTIELKKVHEYFKPNYVIITCPNPSKICVCVDKRGLNNKEEKAHFQDVKI